MITARITHPSQPVTPQSEATLPAAQQLLLNGFEADLDKRSYTIAFSKVVAAYAITQRDDTATQNTLLAMMVDCLCKALDQSEEDVTKDFTLMYNEANREPNPPHKALIAFIEEETASETAAQALRKLKEAAPCA